MADQSLNPSGRTASRPMDAATRAHVLALLHDELVRASREALARGSTPDALAAALDERITQLRAQIDAVPAEDPAPDA